jgi:hydrogenase expression/formation protein HypC
MCLAVPAEVIEVIDESHCRVSLGGVRQEISTDLLDDVRVGEYVIVHVGFALGRLLPEEAKATLALIAAADARAEPEQ